MMRKLTIRCGLLAGLALSAGSALAQSQTPANAQAFLKAVSQTQRVLLTDLNVDSRPTQMINSAESDKCATKFIWREGDQARGVWALDWREVRVSRLEGDRQIRLVGPAVQWLFTFEGNEIAGRMLNAMNIVRRSCDPTQGFGF